MFTHKCQGFSILFSLNLKFQFKNELITKRFKKLSRKFKNDCNQIRIHFRENGIYFNLGSIYSCTDQFQILFGNCNKAPTIEHNFFPKPAVELK